MHARGIIHELLDSRYEGKTSSGRTSWAGMFIGEPENHGQWLSERSQ
jgi:hypothetical protein